MKTQLRKIISLVVIGVLASAHGLQASAEDHRLERMTRKLDLTTEQVEAIQNLNEQISINRPKRGESRKEVVALIDEGQVDAAANLAAENARTRTFQRAERRAGMVEILTPDQFEEWTERKERRDRGGREHGRRQN